MEKNVCKVIKLFVPDVNNIMTLLCMSKRLMDEMKVELHPDQIEEIDMDILEQEWENFRLKFVVNISWGTEKGVRYVIMKFTQHELDVLKRFMEMADSFMKMYIDNDVTCNCDGWYREIYYRITTKLFDNEKI